MHYIIHGNQKMNKCCMCGKFAVKLITLYYSEMPESKTGKPICQQCYNKQEKLLEAIFGKKEDTDEST